MKNAYVSKTRNAIRTTTIYKAGCNIYLLKQQTTRTIIYNNCLGHMLII